jgi:iron-sulfur cluster repair protein YtfE (RIC family)
MTTHVSARIEDSLLAEHARLEELGKQLLIAARSSDSSELLPAWDTFEKGVRAHLETEERDLFPLFEVEHRNETAALRAAHALIRRTLDTVGLSLEFHEARVEALEKVLHQLGEHAALEARVLYPWASSGLPAANRERLVALRPSPLSPHQGQR